MEIDMREPEGELGDLDELVALDLCIVAVNRETGETLPCPEGNWAYPGHWLWVAACRRAEEAAVKYGLHVRIRYGSDGPIVGGVVPDGPIVEGVVPDCTIWHTNGASGGRGHPR